MGELPSQTWPIPTHWPQVTDEQWEVLGPLLPQGARLRAETTRPQFNAMLYALESGCPWRLLPPQFGPWKTVEKRFQRWSDDGAFRNAYAALRSLDALSRGRTLIIGSSYAKVHKSAVGARVGRSGRRCGFWCPQCPRKRPLYCPEDQAIAMTRGGFATKLVMAVNEEGQLVDWRLLPGTLPASTATKALLRRGGPAVLERWAPAVLVGDVSHDNNAFRRMLAALEIEGAIPNRPNRKKPYPPHPALELQRVADDCLFRLRHFRRVATRYEKTREGYDSVIALAVLWTALQEDYPPR